LNRSTTAAFTSGFRYLKTSYLKTNICILQKKLCGCAYEFFAAISLQNKVTPLPLLRDNICAKAFATLAVVLLRSFSTQANLLKTSITTSKYP